MQPSEYSLDIYQGDTGRWQFRFLDGNSQPIDLTGVTAKAQIRDRPGGKHVTNMTCTVTLPNIIDMVLAANDSKDLKINKGAWDIQLTYASGDVRTPVAGAVTVTADVTDSGDPCDA